MTLPLTLDVVRAGVIAAGLLLLVVVRCRRRRRTIPVSVLPPRPPGLFEPLPRARCQQCGDVAALNDGVLVEHYRAGADLDDPTVQACDASGTDQHEPVNADGGRR